MAGWSDVVILRTARTQYENGFETMPEAAPETEAYANRHSVARSEFYAAHAAGRQTDIGFTVRIADYDGQTEVEHNTAVYDVVRTYELDSETIDLTCRRR